MKNYNINMKDYENYLKDLRGSTFKILPLYEDGNKFLDDYLSDLIEEFSQFKKISASLPVTKELDWYVKVILSLENIKDGIAKHNHSYIKKKVFFITNKIQKELEEI